MITSLKNDFLYAKYKGLCPSAQIKRQLSFRANITNTDTVELSYQTKEKNKLENNIETLEQQQAIKLNKFAKNLPNLSRTELATEKYELVRWGGEIDKLETLAKKEGLSNTQQSRLKYLQDKLNLIFQRESEIEESLLPFHPKDTVSNNSEISEHHNIFGYSQSVRNAIESRSNNLKGLSEDEIKSVLLTEKLMKNIDEAFAQLPPLEHDCIVYKGVSEHPDSLIKGYNKAFEMMEKSKIGDIVISDTAYTYTAFERSTAEQWGGEGARHIGKNGEEFRIMMYEIHIPKGAKVSRNFEHRGEILMPRGAQYKITDKKVLPNGDMEITLEYILPKNN